MTFLAKPIMALGFGVFSLVVLLTGAGAVAAMSQRLRLWSVAGFCYAAAAAFASAQVRLDGDYGFVALMFVLLVAGGAFLARRTTDDKGRTADGGD